VYLLPLALLLAWGLLMAFGWLSSPLGILTPLVAALLVGFTVQIRLSVGFEPVGLSYAVDVDERGLIVDAQRKRARRRHRRRDSQQARQRKKDRGGVSSSSSDTHDDDNNDDDDDETVHDRRHHDATTQQEQREGTAAHSVRSSDSTATARAPKIV